MILGVQGEVATGKTTIAYTAPGRVIGFSFDLGADRAIYGAQYNKLFADKTVDIVGYKKPVVPLSEPEAFSAAVGALWNPDANIQVFELPMPIQLDQYRVFGCRELWSYFMVLLGKTIEDDSVRSAVLDTATQARRVKADAYLQELQEKHLAEKPKEVNKLRKQLLQIEWGHPNDTIRNIYSMFKGTGKNLITIHHLTDEYESYVKPSGEVDSRASGKRVVSEGSVDPDRQWDVGVETIKTSAGVEVKYVKCGFNLRLEGLKVGTIDGAVSWNSMIDEIWTSLDNRPELARVLERA